MPLIINGESLGVTIPATLEELWEKFPKLKEASEKIINTPVKTLDPKGLLYVGQREFAGTSPADDSISVLGADSATTGQIVILRETGSGSTCIGHFDGTLTTEGVSGMMNTIMQIAYPKAERFELILAGGFKDEHDISVKLSRSLLREFNRSPENIDLIAAAITDINTVWEKSTPYPVIRGMAVDMKTKDIFPAYYNNRGPDYPLRNAQLLLVCNPRFPCLYYFQKKHILIEPFDYLVDVYECEYIIQLPDEDILKKYSTSPKQEQPDFPEMIRNMFRFLEDNLDPLETVFPKNLPRWYKQSSEGKWVFDGNRRR